MSRARARKNTPMKVIIHAAIAAAIASAALPGTPPEDSAVTTAQTAAAMAVDPGPPDAPVAAQPQQSVMLVRRADRPSLDPVLVSAYAAYQNGDLAGAVRLYEQVLAEVPLNRDALMGLATIARRDGDATRARELYSRLLTRDPRDPAAKAGLGNARSPSSFSTLTMQPATSRRTAESASMATARAVRLVSPSTSSGSSSEESTGRSDSRINSSRIPPSTSSIV